MRRYTNSFSSTRSCSSMSRLAPSCPGPGWEASSLRGKCPVLGSLSRLDQHHLGIKRPDDFDLGVCPIRVLPLENHRALWPRDDTSRRVHPLLAQRISQADGRNQQLVRGCLRSLAVPIVPEVLKLHDAHDGWL